MPETTHEIEDDTLAKIGGWLCTKERAEEVRFRIKVEGEWDTLGSYKLRDKDAPTVKEGEEPETEWSQADWEGVLAELQDLVEEYNTRPELHVQLQLRVGQRGCGSRAFRLWKDPSLPAEAPDAPKTRDQWEESMTRRFDRFMFWSERMQQLNYKTQDRLVSANLELVERVVGARITEAETKVQLLTAMREDPWEALGVDLAGQFVQQKLLGRDPMKEAQKNPAGFIKMFLSKLKDEDIATLSKDPDLLVELAKLQMRFEQAAGKP